LFRYPNIEIFVIKQLAVFGWWLDLMHRGWDTIDSFGRPFLEFPMFLFTHHRIPSGIQGKFRFNTWQLFVLGNKNYRLLEGWTHITVHMKISCIE